MPLLFLLFLLLLLLLLGGCYGRLSSLPCILDSGPNLLCRSSLGCGRGEGFGGPDPLLVRQPPREAPRRVRDERHRELLREREAEVPRVGVVHVGGAEEVEQEPPDAVDERQQREQPRYPRGGRGAEEDVVARDTAPLGAEVDTLDAEARTSEL